MADTTLLPDRHPQADIFICDITDAAVKDDMASMEHPIFELSTKPRMTTKRYEHRDYWLEVTPSDKGIANIYDKDILIFAVSQIMAAKNAGLHYSRHLSFTAYDCLVFGNRNVGGKDYRSLEDSLRRLAGTRIVTNITTGDELQTHNFGLIAEYKVRRERLDGRILEWGITLSDWLFNAIESNEVLTLSADYFRLRKPLERRLYELARKHCGTKLEWKIGLELLIKKSGSSSTKGNFKATLKEIVRHDHLPDYHVRIEGDIVLFSRKQQQSAQVELPGITPHIPTLKTSTYDKFRNNHPGYDPHTVEQEWRDWAMKKPSPDNADAAFLAFSKSYAAHHPARN